MQVRRVTALTLHTIVYVLKIGLSLGLVASLGWGMLVLITGYGAPGLVAAMALLAVVVVGFGLAWRRSQREARFLRTGEFGVITSKVSGLRSVVPRKGRVDIVHVVEDFEAVSVPRHMSNMLVACCTADMVNVRIVVRASWEVSRLRRVPEVSLLRGMDQVVARHLRDTLRRVVQQISYRHLLRFRPEVEDQLERGVMRLVERALQVRLVRMRVQVLEVDLVPVVLGSCVVLY